ncbi:hypothetical protein PUNSTDRAFT_146254 [Punctularia strigosozonata HHB-11173 SS5]|uniref:Uncharacterized protein n=1 Tax=Punctularia strigosozonata (strain HHB-11173) TaxID=741275 RepID=R7S467_PUNST|nr:uncharacterized protein PUNSTDRAFT_146254 [Punctularia strigosozonata HHB-11173 SS5]EIN05013.1 hypothetical protein PUNSTDRAFT_146254 [Punctularia strigosozonata HHB-11173 SS5]
MSTMMTPEINSVPSLRRRSSVHTRSSLSLLKHRSVHVLPELSEADEEIIFGVTSRRNGDGDDHRLSRRLSAALDEITLDDALFFASSPPRPAPQPPTPTTMPRASKSTFGPSPLDDDEPLCPPSADSFCLTFATDGASYGFPRPPPPTTTTPKSSTSSDTSSDASTSRSRSKSPAPSVASSSSSGSSTAPTTPTHSDDEFPAASLLKVQLANIRPLSIHKPATPEPRSASGASDDETDDCDSDGEWYASQFTDMLAAPVAPATPAPSERARPESFLPPPRTRDSQCSEPPSPSSPLPSTQLDPMFGSTKARRRSSKIPARPPPPPPLMLLPPTPPPAICITPTDSSYCSSSSSYDHFDYRRPLPARESVPTDVFELEMDGDELTFLLASDAATPASPAPSDANSLSTGVSAMSIVDFIMDDLPLDLTLHLESSLEDLDIDWTPRRAPPLPVSPARSTASTEPVTDWAAMGVLPQQDKPAPALRSRWSSSTLASVAEAQSPSSPGFRMLNFYFAKKGSKGKSPLSVASTSSTSNSTSASASASSTPTKGRGRRISMHVPSLAFGHNKEKEREAAAAKLFGGGAASTGAQVKRANSATKKVEFDVVHELRRGVVRRGSRSSQESVASRDSILSDGSSSSKGLPSRKPIPVEIFMRR